MKKYFALTALLLLACLLCACSPRQEVINMNGVKMTAIIKNLDGKIEVEVIEDEYNGSGLYWLNISNETVFADENNETIRRSDLDVGDVVEITYDGKVMLSYPPQIIVLKIKRIK